jgi:hypothetical protein
MPKIDAESTPVPTDIAKAIVPTVALAAVGALTQAIVSWGTNRALTRRFDKPVETAE